MNANQDSTSRHMANQCREVIPSDFGTHCHCTLEYGMAEGTRRDCMVCDVKPTTAPESAREPWSPGSYTVIFRNGAGRICRTTCVVIPGYSTVADIPKMITIKYGDACEILATMAMGMDTALLSSVLASLTGLRD